ncbi:MAG TPA: hypothetical protein VM492_06870, partial [Sumerlaeia bacterium]|nr:hypothetical protein [Sumerlaeia bacterium]
SVGSRKRSPGRAILFEIDKALLGDSFDLSPVEEIRPHPDGTPKHSLTVSIYRVLERVPIRSLGRLFLVTRDGKILDIPPQPYSGGEKRALWLYKELCPVHPTVASKLQPAAFGRFITREAHAGVPKILFVDLLLGQIGDPSSEMPAHGLPYRHMGLIRDAVSILRESERHTLVVDGAHAHDFFYRTIGEGFFLSDGDTLLYYPFPTAKERETGKVHDWWRSAELS